MPLKSGHFTEQELAFVDAYLDTHDAQKAGKLAGYKIARHGFEVLQRPEIIAEIKRRMSLRLHAELVPLALGHLSHVLQDQTATNRDKNQAASIVLKQAQAIDGGAGEKELHEMSAEELDAKIERIRQEMASRAKLIEGEVLEVDQVDEDPFA